MSVIEEMIKHFRVFIHGHVSVADEVPVSSLHPKWILNHKYLFISLGLQMDPSNISVPQVTSTMSLVTGIIINCTSERCNGGGIFRPVQIDTKHPIYQHGVVAPLSKLVELPLLVYKHPLKGTGGIALQNEIAEMLMVGQDGKTTTDFTEQPGSVTIVRKDGKPLTRPAIEAIWMFNDYFLEQLQEDKRIAERLLNRSDFNNFCEDYKEDRVLQGHTTFTRLELPL